MGLALLPRRMTTSGSRLTSVVAANPSKRTPPQTTSHRAAVPTRTDEAASVRRDAGNSSMGVPVLRLFDDST